MGIAYLSHPDCAAHDMGHRHPEQPARLAAINDRLIATGLDLALTHYDAPLVEDAQLALAHDSAYLHALKEQSPAEGVSWVDGDTAMNPHSLQAARRAAGAVVKAVDLVLHGETKRAFCGVRPPGHHAKRDRAMGFCFYNNIAIGALHAIASHGLERVAIVDFDVHHGNGTEHIVAGDKRVLFCSTFQHPFYPGSGHECDETNVVNVPMAQGTGSEGFRSAVTEHWLPALDAFRPELVMVSAGFDAHQADDMAGINLVDTDYAWITEQILEIANRHAQGRVVSSLEGGYELHALARSVEAHLKAMLG
ncbi:MAG: histone deacetylase family protein [Pseudomonadota bacterium]